MKSEFPPASNPAGQATTTSKSTDASNLKTSKDNASTESTPSPSKNEEDSNDVKEVSTEVGASKTGATPVNLGSEFPVKFDNGTWKLVSDRDGVQTYRTQQPEAGVVSFRGETLVPASLVKIATILNTDNLRKEWVEGLLETKRVAENGKLERIEYNRTKAPWPFQDRDFLYKVNVYVKHEPLALLITMKSVEDSRMPPIDGLVRASILHSYYYMKEVPGVRATKVVIEMAVDPKGEIPLWVMNMVQQNWPYKTLQALRKIAQREEIAPSEEVQNFLYNGNSNGGAASSPRPMAQEGPKKTSPKLSTKSKLKEGTKK